ncbi:hypothetical protein PMIN06_004628 [Paraphaeosphaeria minitans]
MLHIGLPSGAKPEENEELHSEITHKICTRIGMTSISIPTLTPAEYIMRQSKICGERKIRPTTKETITQGIHHYAESRCAVRTSNPPSNACRHAESSKKDSKEICA